MSQPLTQIDSPALSTGPRWQHALGILLLLFWVLWWGFSWSLDVPRLIWGEQTMLGSAAWPYLGIDFLHEYSGGYALAHGANPYEAIAYHPLFKHFTYPPAILPFFLWCGLLPPGNTITIPRPQGDPFVQIYPMQAVGIWLLVLTAIFIFAAWLAWRQRIRLGLKPIAFPLVLALFLLSFPVIFAMERTGSDALLLLLILLGSLALFRKTFACDLLAGLCFALAAWMKLYPAFIVLALIGLRRWRATLAMCGGMLLVGLATIPWVMQWISIVRVRLATPGAGNSVLPHSHTISGAWHGIWSGSPFSFLSSIPGALAAGVIVLIVAGMVTRHVFQSPDKDKLLIPYILWMAALSTFWPLVSYDYNLIYLPLAALIVWRASDPLPVHLLGLLYLVWWQPLMIQQTPLIALVLKFAGILAVGLSLIAKTRTPARVS